MVTGVWTAEVAGVSFSDSESAPVPKFWNPGQDPRPAIFQIWESDSCSDSGYNHQSNLNLPMFLLKEWPQRLLLLLKMKSGSGPVFPKFLLPNPGPKEKRRILPGSTPVMRIRSYFGWTGVGFSNLKNSGPWIKNFGTRAVSESEKVTPATFDVGFSNLKIAD